MTSPPVPDDLAVRLAVPSAERAALVRELADGGETEAQALLGQMLLDGVEMPRDERAAFLWFNRAAARHHLMALNMVGRCYDLGWGVAIDKARAAECFRLAAARGLDWGRYNWATALALGEGVERDRGAALTLFEQVAGGEGPAAAKAANFVGSFAEDGWAGPVDMVRAAAFYSLAAEGGDFRGAFNHARMLIDAGDVDAALPWIERAGATGNGRFVRQVAEWLARAPVPGLRSRGSAALSRGVASC